MGIDLSTHSFYRLPLAHQLEGLRRSAHEEIYQLIYDPRCGKTKVVWDTAQLTYRQPPHNIDGVLIISWPAGVHRVWVEDEMPKDLPPNFPVRAVVWRSGKMGTAASTRDLAELLEFEGLSVLSINCEALLTETAWKYISKFIQTRRLLVVADEDWATSPSAARTKRLWAIGRHPNAVLRRHLSGTPVDESPLDIWAVGVFLDWRLLGHKSFYTFKQRYAQLEEGYAPGGRTFKKIVGYQNLEELQEKLAKFSHRVRRADVSDAPAKTYSKRYFQLSPKQAEVYARLRDEYVAEIGRGEMPVPHVLDRLTKLSMIARGYFPPQRLGVPCPNCDERGCDACDGTGVVVEVTNLQRIDPNNSPAREALLSELRLVSAPVVVWTRFIQDAVDVTEALFSLGRRVGRYDGTIKPKEREETYLAFKAGELDGIVATGTSGISRGHDLSRAEVMVYYSDGYSLRQRRQTEDRAEKIDRRVSTTIIDLIAEGTVDEARVQTQRDKLTLAEMLMRDPPSRWL